MFSGIHEIVDALLSAKPFLPFEIWIGGEGTPISDPELAKPVDEDGGTLAVYDSAKDRTAFINLHAIDSIRIRGKRLKF